MDPLFLMCGTSLLVRYHTSPRFANATTVHEAKSFYFELGTKLDGNGKDNKRELLEEHNTDFYFFYD